jgi:hypothetical protein
MVGTVGVDTDSAWSATSVAVAIALLLASGFLACGLLDHARVLADVTLREVCRHVRGQEARILPLAGSRVLLEVRGS